MAFEQLFKLIKFFENIKGDELFVDIVERDKNLQVEILDLNRIDQLFNQGIDSQGTLIGVYSPTTDILSGGEKKTGTHYTFKDTGIFFDSFRILTRTTFIEIIANPLRDGTNLFDKYTPDLVGLTAESKAKLQSEMIPLIQEFVRNKLRRL